MKPDIDTLNARLLAAVKAGDSWEVPFLLSQGADVNAVGDGWTALMYAASMAREETLRLLLEHGADVHRTSASGRTALQVAQGLGHSGIVAILKKAAGRRAAQKEAAGECQSLHPSAESGEEQESVARAEKYILLDLENLVPSAEDIHRLMPECKILCFSKALDKISVALAQALQNDGRCEFVLTNATGKNALDFHIAFYLGALSHTHPECAAYVVSKDTGYDSLIQWINQHTGIAARRISSFDSLPKNVYQPKLPQLPQPSLPPPRDVRAGGEQEEVSPHATPGGSTLEKNVQDAIQALAKQARPSKRKTLMNALGACFHPKLSKDMLAKVLHELVAVKKCIVIDDNDNVSYAPPITAVQSETFKENVRKAIADLSGRKNSRPRKRKTLINTLGACFHPKLPEDMLAKILHELVAVKKCIVIDSKDNVTYAHPITAGK